MRRRFLSAEQEVGTCQATQKAQDPPLRLIARTHPYPVQPRSQASGAVRPASDSVEGISHALQQVTDFVRGQPLASMGTFIIAGIVIGKVLSRR